MTADGLQFIVCFLNAVNTASFITSDRKGCNGDIKSRRLQSKVKIIGLFLLVVIIYNHRNNIKTQVTGAVSRSDGQAGPVIRRLYRTARTAAARRVTPATPAVMSQ